MNVRDTKRAMCKTSYGLPSSEVLRDSGCVFIVASFQSADHTPLENLLHYFSDRGSNHRVFLNEYVVIPATTIPSFLAAQRPKASTIHHARGRHNPHVHRRFHQSCLLSPAGTLVHIRALGEGRTSACHGGTIRDRAPSELRWLVLLLSRRMLKPVRQRILVGRKWVMGDAGGVTCDVSVCRVQHVRMHRPIGPGSEGGYDHEAGVPGAMGSVGEEDAVQAGSLRILTDVY